MEVQSWAGVMRGREEDPAVTILNSGLAEFAEHGVNRVESGVDLLSDLKKRR